jgi:hypothetical protein
MGLVFTNITDLTVTDRWSIGSFRTINFSFEINKATTALTDLICYFKPVQWINGSILPETPLTAPTKSYFEYLPTGATALNTYYACTFIAGTNDENNLNYSAFVKFIDVGGHLKIEYLQYAVNVADTLTYLNGLPNNQQNKLQKDDINNAVIFDNTSNDAYLNIRWFRIAVWLLEPSINTLSFTRLQREENPIFYYPLDARYNPIWSDASFNLLFCNTPSTTLSTITDTNISFQLTQLNADTVDDFYWQIYRSDINGQNVDEIINYHLNSVKDDLTAPTWQTDFNTYSDLFLAPALAFTGASPGTWSGNISISATNLVNNAKYRIYVLIKTDNGVNKDWWAFTSEELIANNCQCFVPPVLSTDSGINDYLHFLGPAVLTAPQERLQSVAILDFAPYNTSRPFQALPDALTQINMKYYWIDAVNPIIHHITDEFSIFKNMSGTFTTASNNPFGTSDPVVTITGQILEIDIEFRNHFETNIPNLYDLNTTNNTILVPTVSLDWTNKTVYIQHELVLTQSIYTDTIQLTFTNAVHDYNENTVNDMAFIITDMNGNEIGPNICATVAQVNICSTTTDSDVTNCAFISGLDASTIQVANFIEDEEFSGILPQLQNSLINYQDITYAAGAQACSNIQLSNMSNNAYQFVAIKKHIGLAIQPPCCDIDVDVQAIVDAMTLAGEIPDTTRIHLICQEVQKLKMCNVWDKLERLYFYATHGLTSAAALIDWKNPSSGGNNIIEHNGIATGWLANTGYIGNSVDWYLETTFTPSVNGGKYNQLGSGFGDWVEGAIGTTYSQYDHNPSSHGLTGIVANAYYLHDTTLIRYAYNQLTNWPITSTLYSGYRTGLTIQAYANALPHDAPSIIGSGGTTPNMHGQLTGAGLAIPDQAWLKCVSTDAFSGGPVGTYMPNSQLMRISYFSEYLTPAEHMCLYNALSFWITNI